MIIYVESNFVLEVAFAQEESQACEEILDLAEAGRVDIVLPAFSISEPYDTLRRREARRSKLHDDVARELGELRRTASYAEQVERLLGPLGLLVRSSGDETARLDNALKRLVDTAELVPVDAGILVRASAGGRDSDAQRREPPSADLLHASYGKLTIRKKTIGGRNVLFRRTASPHGSALAPRAVVSRFFGIVVTMYCNDHEPPARPRARVPAGPATLEPIPLLEWSDVDPSHRSPVPAGL